MIIRYNFLNGETTDVNVSDNIGNIILSSRRNEHANNERHRYHSAFSVDDITYENSILFSSSDNPLNSLIEKENTIEYENMLAKLTSIQRRRFEKYVDGMSISDIARLENTSFNSIKESIEAAKRKLKKFF